MDIALVSRCICFLCMKVDVVRSDTHAIIGRDAASGHKRCTEIAAMEVVRPPMKNCWLHIW